MGCDEMTDVKREIHLLVTIAKLDAELNECRTEASLLPEKIAKTEAEIKIVEKSMADADAHLESMNKEKRTLEQKIQDSGEKLKKLRIQLMEVKKNEEYQAMLHEIGHMEKAIDESEERLLMIMDELDQQGVETGDFKKQKGEAKQQLAAEKDALEQRLERLKKDLARLEGEKPKILVELDPQIRKRYDRILAKLHDFAVTHIADEYCQGCHSRIPPQAAMEVRRNDQIIACQACGRILVHYIA
jgi:predicted  nucleic acid-binding Zn-ribbon protein